MIIMFNAIVDAYEILKNDIFPHLPENNGALRIMLDLTNKLNDCGSLEELFNNNPDIKSTVIEMYQYANTECDKMSQEPNFDQNVTFSCKENIRFGLTEPNVTAITKYHILGDYLQNKLLFPRFVKENRDPNLSGPENIKVWFNRNEKLDFDSDRVIVQSANLMLFFIKYGKHPITNFC